MPQRKGPSLIPMSSKANNLEKAELKKALEEDPNIFEYDDVYDDLKKTNETPGSSSGNKNQAPKYMSNLLKSAELRKREQERREEKKIQKERETEGDEFQDKDSFITPAYKEKLKELRETEEREKREAACESVLDVKRQQDLSGFYRHFLNQAVGSESVPSQSTSDRFQSKSGNDGESLPTEFKSVRGTKRNLRNRRDSGSSSSDEEEPPKQEDGTTEAIVQPLPQETAVEKPITTPEVTDSSKQEEPKENQKSDSKTEVVQETPIEPKPDRKTLILLRFEKRTVDKVFEEAVERYHERKNAINT